MESGQSAQRGERESRERLRAFAQDALSRAAGARLVSGNRISLLKAADDLIHALRAYLK